MKSTHIQCIRVFADQEQIRQCREDLKENEEKIRRLSGVLSMAGNEVRLKILFLLRREAEMCPCDLSDVLGMSLPAISQHLRKLKDAGIIGSRKAGQLIFYFLLADYEDVLHPLLGMLKKDKSIVQ